MKTKFFAFVVFALLASFSCANADFIYTGPGGGQIDLNCDSCDVTTATLVSWSGVSISLTGTNLTATPTGITFTPTAGADAIFNLASGGFFYGAVNGTVGGGTGSCTIGTPGCTAVGNPQHGVQSACIAIEAANNYGFCQSGNLTIFSTTSPLVIATANFAVPGPIVGAGLPGLVAAFGGFLAWRRRKTLNQFSVA
jgi:hypothetical protein